MLHYREVEHLNIVTNWNMFQQILFVIGTFGFRREKKHTHVNDVDKIHM